MVEENKAFLDKVDTLNNFVDSGINFVSIENLSWGKKEMGISILNLWP